MQEFSVNVCNFMMSKMSNHAVHLQAAFCAVGCNRVVRRRGLMRPLHALLHRAHRAGGHQARKTVTNFSARPLRSGASRSLDIYSILIMREMPSIRVAIMLRALVEAFETHLEQMAEETQFGFCLEQCHTPSIPDLNVLPYRSVG